MNGIDKIGQWFFEDENLCRKEPVMLSMGEECYVLDLDIFDEVNETYTFVPCIVVRVDQSSIPGRWYYVLQAKDSVNDEQLNSNYDAGISFYKYLENTSPYLYKINHVEDR